MEKTKKKAKSSQPTEHKIIRFDWAMKTLLRNKANFDILEGFLSELLNENIKIESLLESESNQDYADLKMNRVDLLVNTNHNEKIIIEVQTISEWDFFHRILFGTAKVVTEYIRTGEKYGCIPRVISVNILFFNLGVGNDYVYKGQTDFFGVHKKDKLELKEQSIQMYLKEFDKNINHIAEIFPTYYLIQLKKFTNIIKDKFDQWVYMLKNESIRSDFNAKGIQSASEKLNVLKLSESARRQYDKYWEDLSLEASLVASHEADIAVAEKKGITIGIEKTAKNMRKKGLSDKLIAEYTGLSLAEIKKIH